MRDCGGEDGGRAACAVLLAAGLIAAAGCGADSDPPTTSNVLPEGVESAALGMRTTITRNGVRRGVVESDTAHWHAENEIHLRPMRLTFFDLNGQESTVVTSEYGIFYELTGDLDADGSVVAVDQVQGQRLETEQLRYDNEEGQLQGTTFFRLLQSDGTVLEGSSFESDPTLDHVTVGNPSGESPSRSFAPPATTAPPAATPDSTATAEDDSTSAGDDATAAVADDSVAAAAADTSAAAPPDTATMRPGASATARPDIETAPAEATTTPPDTVAVRPGAATAPPETVGGR